jgi:hypothetical protein
VDATKLFASTGRACSIDWSEVKNRIDLGLIATALLGPSPGRRGARGRLWWRCPFHDDKNPSFNVDPRKGTWNCFGCSEHGDAADLVMKRLGVPFPEAVRWLADQSNMTVGPRPGQSKHTNPSIREHSGPERKAPSGVPLADALALVRDAERRLWMPEGATALRYLRNRGLEHQTIRAARLGWTSCTEGVAWQPPGVVIPWFDGDRLALVKVRPPDEWRERFPEKKRPPKYIQGFQDRPSIFPSPSAVRPGKGVVACEGEFDALLMAQELADLDVSVITFGSASARPDPSTLDLLSTAPAWYLALDADQAGDTSAASWPARARRVRPPAPYKDWTEFHQAGFNNIRCLWAGILTRPRTSWDELAAKRSGSAFGGPTAGIIIERRER